jgi:hypothetical protein
VEEGRGDPPQLSAGDPTIMTQNRCPREPGRGRGNRAPSSADQGHGWTVMTHGQGPWPSTELCQTSADQDTRWLLTEPPSRGRGHLAEGKGHGGPVPGSRTSFRGARRAVGGQRSLCPGGTRRFGPWCTCLATGLAWERPASGGTHPHTCPHVYRHNHGPVWTPSHICWTVTNSSPSGTQGHVSTTHWHVATHRGM